MSSHPESKNPKPKMDSVPEPVTESESMSSSSSTVPSAKNRSLKDLRIPLLSTDEPHETGKQSIDETSDSQSILSRCSSEFERQSEVGDENNSRPKKMGRNARMLDLTKKMGEKFEEKKRHIEERGRHIVDKMRGP